MRIKLDRTICDGFGLCAVHAPETFSFDDWGYVSLMGDSNIAQEREAGVRRALLDCPVHAIIELTERAVPAFGAPQAGSGTTETSPTTRVVGNEA